MADLPSTFDRADGLDERLGIATPANSVFVTDNGITYDYTATDFAIKIREAANSPDVERAEQATITHTFYMDWEEGKTRLEAMGRGTLLVSEDGDVSRVLSSRLQRERGGYCSLVVTAESVSFDSPPDDFSLEPVELGVHIIKHPRYYSALNPDSTDWQSNVTVNDTTVYLGDIKQSIIRAIQTYMDAPIYPSEYNINGYFQGNVLSQLAGNTIDVQVFNTSFNPNSTNAEAKVLHWNGANADRPNANCRYFAIPVPSTAAPILMAKAAAREIISKIWRQEEQPYIVGYQMSWASYYFRPPELSPGGYTCDPIMGTNSSLEVPDYFISTEYPPNRNLTIFDYLPVLNPQSYSISGSRPSSRGSYGVNYNISWLRKADQIEYQRTWFKITRTWMGAPIGIWDTELYGDVERPASPSDYVIRFPALEQT